MDARAMASFAGRLRPGLVALAHVNADPDAVGSAYALAEAYGGTVAAPDLSAPGRRLADALGLEVLHALPPDAPRVVVDASSALQLRPWEDRLAPYLLVDHHAPGALAEGAEAALVVPRTSCAEVVLALLDAAGRPPAPDAAFALLCGLVADTGRFRFADAATFRAAERLLGASGRRLDDALALLEEDDEGASRSARIASLKAAQRTIVDDADGLVVALATIGSHEAAAAVGLVRLGADVALVASDRDDGTRVSGRASRTAAADVHLGELFRAVAHELGVSGGGHAASAGMNGKVDPQVALARLREAVARAARERGSVA